MKFKKLLLVSIFLLTILTIGAASAAENATDSDTLDAAGDVIIQSIDESDVLSEGYYYDSDFYIYVQENFTHGKHDWNSYDVVSIHSYSEKNSTIDIFVDGAEKKSINATGGYFSIEIDENGTEHKIFSTFVYPNDLGITPGSHNIKVNVNGNTKIDTPVSINEMEDFTIWLQNPYYCEAEYWQSPSFLIIDSNNLNNGTLEVYVNGTRKLSFAVANGLFEEIENCSSKSRYVAASDILGGYGNYNIQIKFTENGATKTLKDEKVTVAEFEPTTNPKLELYFELYTLHIPDTDYAYIYLPREATGTLTISYNNQNENISYSKGYARYEMPAWSLNHLGENEITVTYVGDDFGTLTATGTVIVEPTITAPSYVSVGEEFNISMKTHDWVNGKFNVYDYNDGIKGKLLATSEIKAYSGGYVAVTSVNLSGEKAGLNRYYLEFDYPGGDYPLIQEVYVIQNSENVKVDVPREVEIGSEFNVTVYAPDIDFTFAQISVDGGDIQFVMFENGVAKKNISNLTVGYHIVKVFYENMYYRNGEWLREVYLDNFTVNVASKTNLTALDVVMDYNSTDKLLITLKDENNTALSGKDIKINLNNQNYSATTGDNGQAVLPISDLPAGKFTALISFEGSEGYLSSNANSQITVNKIGTSLEANNVTMSYGDNDALVITLKDANSNPLAGKEITIQHLDGKTYTRTTNASGQASLNLNLDVAVYTAVINFEGDNNYLGSEILSKITVNKAKSQFNASDITVTVGTSNDVAIALTDCHGVGLANKNVVVFINSQNNTATDGNGIVKLTINLTEGTYSSFIYFGGDNNYESARASFKVSAVKSKTQMTASNITATYGEVKNLTVTLKDAQGVALVNKVISIRLNNVDYTRTTDGNGKVSIPVDLDAGKYDAQISFAGDSSYYSSATVSTITVNKAEVQITALDISTTYNVGKNLVITLKTADGKVLADKSIVVTLNNKPYDRTTDSNGQAVVSSYNLAPKTYTADIKFNGDGNYMESGSSAKVVVNKALPKIIASNKAYKVKTKTKQYTITLKNNKNAVLKKKPVTLKVGGKTYKATTNSKGKATFKITKLTKKGTFKAVIKYAGDSYYKSVSKTTKITVKK